MVDIDVGLKLLELLNDGRPSSLAECMKEDGQVDLVKYMEFADKEYELDQLERNKLASAVDDVDDGATEERSNDNNKTKRKTRTRQTLRPYYFDDNGEMVFLKPEETVWYLCYVQGPALDDDKFNKKFRRRFRMPYNEYTYLLNKVKKSAYFVRWMSKDAAGKDSSPIELLFLGALRYLGRGLTFDDLEEYTAIHEETHRQFLHQFIEYGSDVLVAKYINPPTTAEEYSHHQREYTMGGLNGAGFSTDATNVIMWRCAHNLKQMNMGFKQNHTARTYNLTCNHRREILYTTGGHPSRWNDKTLAYFDGFLKEIQKGEILQDVTFTLFEYSDTGDVVERGYAGAWGLVDAGYHKWTCTQAPEKVHIRLADQRLSEWIESFRKDAECVFGILKGRWRVLKTGIRLHGCGATDKIWLTCCALHNFLLFVDGLSGEWLHGDYLSDYEGELGENDPEDASLAPFALQRLNETELRRFGSHQHYLESLEQARTDATLDGSSTNRMFFDEPEENSHEMVNEEQGSSEMRHDDKGNIYINSLSYGEFRSRLVTHFDILYKQNKVQWPRAKIATV